MELIIIIGVLALGGWLLFREKKEDKLVREVREAEQAKTRKLRQEVEAVELAAAAARAKEKAALGEKIDGLRREFYFGAASYYWIEKDDGFYFYRKDYGFERSYVGPFRNKTELNQAYKAWYGYLLVTCPYKLELEANKRLKAQFKKVFSNAERFGWPDTIAEANIAAERVHVAARMAAVRMVTESYVKRADALHDANVREVDALVANHRQAKMDARRAKLRGMEQHFNGVMAKHD